MTIFDELIPRLIIDTETDADSPDNETTYDGIRKLIEGLILSLFATGVSGTVTGISGATLTDTGNFTIDQCNGWTLIITSNDAIGNFYTIDDTTADTLVCTGDDLETDGVAIGDTYVVVYDLKVNADGHDHDGLNSKSAVLADDSILTAKYGPASVDQTALGANCVGQSEIKEGTGDASAVIAATARAYFVLQDYCFSPNFYCASGFDHITFHPHSTAAAGTYSARFSAYNDDVGGGHTLSVLYRYITATDEAFFYIIRDKSTGEIIATWACTDPPPGYWGLDEKPVDFVPPIILNPAPPNIEDITLFKYSMEGYREIINKSKKDNKPIHEHINDYDYNDKSKLFTAKNLSMI